VFPLEERTRSNILQICRRVCSSKPPCISVIYDRKHYILKKVLSDKYIPIASMMQDVKRRFGLNYSDVRLAKVNVDFAEATSTSFESFSSQSSESDEKDGKNVEVKKEVVLKRKLSQVVVGPPAKKNFVEKVFELVHLPKGKRRSFMLMNKFEGKVLMDHERLERKEKIATRWFHNERLAMQYLKNGIVAYVFGVSDFNFVNILISDARDELLKIDEMNIFKWSVKLFTNAPRDFLQFMKDSYSSQILTFLREEFVLNTEIETLIDSYGLSMPSKYALGCEGCENEPNGRVDCSILSILESRKMYSTRFFEK